MNHFNHLLECPKIIKRRVDGAFKVSNQELWGDLEGRRLSWETGIAEVSFEVFPERCDIGAISNLERKGVPKN